MKSLLNQYIIVALRSKLQNQKVQELQSVKTQFDVSLAEEATLSLGELCELQQVEKLIV